MKPISRSDSAAEEQASLWAARLEGGTLDAADRTALDAWLAASPSHRALLSDYCQFSADLEQVLPELVSSGAVQLPDRAAKPARRWSLGWLAGAGSLAAAAVVAVVLYSGAPSGDAIERAATSTGQRQSLVLSDGTRVELDARTSLQAEIGRSERRVRLAEGQAYFQVSKDPSRPFIVETPAGAVRVTGTTFDVHTETPTDLTVSVVEGSVQVRPATSNDVFALTAGDVLSATSKGTLRRKLSSANLEDALAWRQGMAVFDGQSLRTALARFARYHGRGVNVSDAAAAKLVGGRYSLDDFDGFLAGLEAPLGIRWTRDAAGSVSVKLRTEP